MSPQADSPAGSLTTVQQQMQAGQFRAALKSLHTLLEKAPDEADALYMQAVCLRYLEQYPAAEATLQRLLRLTPEHSRAHQEAGHLYKRTGQLERALAAYARACQLNPALVASFRGQLDILLARGAHAQAEAVRNQLQHLQQLPKALVAVTDLMAQGKLARADELCRKFLQQHPTHVEGMRLLAELGMRFGVLEDAEFLLASALRLAPEHVPARIDLVQVLRRRQKFDAALAETSRLLERMPDNPQIESLHAIVSMQRGDYDQALALFDRVLKRLPDDPATLTARGHALKTCGRTREAIASYQRVIEVHPNHGEAYHALANLKTYAFSDHELEQMQAREQDPTLGHMDRVYLNFALGKAWEDRHNHAEAFRCYAEGNALKLAQSKYDPDRISDEFRRQQQVCTAEFFRARADVGCPEPDPIFIVGLPRAGSTLLEQILASHSQVDGTQELPNIISLTQQLRRRPLAGSRQRSGGAYPEILEALTANELRQFGAAYLEETRIHRGQAPFFIDKMPNNFRHIGLIRLILPNAKIIDARRHPLACCFSGYKQLFAEGQEFSYSLEHIGRYYRDYVALMDHWDRVLPGHVLRVNHEDVVDDLEGQVRRLLAFCGLPFEQACVEYHRTERTVRTPSSEQVRQPIFREGVEQWQHFEPWLEPLRAALGDAVLQRHPPR